MKLFPVLLLASLVSLTLGCKGGKNQQASTPPPAPITIIDTDKDGIADVDDSDDDNDGVVDAQDRFPLDPNEMRDSDGDNQGDKADLDDDNDGLADALDAFPLDPKEQKDSDGDGIGNNADSDDDNDGIADVNDHFPLSNVEALDSDGDGLGNNADTDDDNDGVTDEQDALPLNPKERLDFDKDGLGDSEDPDDDNDGIADVDDKFPLDNKDSKDADADGIGDNADTDDDNDGTPDVADAQPFNPKEQTDTDGDGMGNHQDDDDDNDGVVDAKDKFPLDAKETLDYDLDGIGDNTDADDDNDGISDVDDKVLGLIKPSNLTLEDGKKVKIASSGTIAYVINSSSKILASIDLASGATNKSITLSDTPTLIELSPDGSRIFIASTSIVTTDFWNTQVNKVQAFSAGDLSKLAEINTNDTAGALTPVSNQQVLLTPPNYPLSFIYDLSNNYSGYAVNGGTINAYDSERGILYSTNSIGLTKSIRAGSSFQPVKSNDGLSFATDDQLWLSAKGNLLLSSAGQIIDTETLVKVNQLELASAKITGIFFDKANNLVFFALNTGALAVANANTFELIQIQPITSTPLLGVSIIGQHLITLTKADSGMLSFIDQNYDCPECFLNVAPKAVATVNNAVPLTGQAVQFDATGTTDPEQDTLQYRWDLDGDGTWDTQLSATAKADFQYDLPGTYSARLQVIDAKGASAQAVVAVKVLQSKVAPTVRDGASEIFDFPTVRGIFDGKDTVYYLDEFSNRVYLVSLASGRAERYFQFDYPAKELFNSTDLSTIYVVQYVGSQKIKTLVAAIDTAEQMVVGGTTLNGQYARFMYLSAGRFLAAFNNYTLIDSVTGAVTQLPLSNFYYSLYTNEAGNIYSVDSYSASRLALRGDELVVDKTLINNSYLGSLNAPIYISRDEGLLLGGSSIVPLKNPTERNSLPIAAIRVVGDPKRNVVFAITVTGSVEVINTSTGQVIKTITLSRPIKDVIVKDDQLFLVLEVNALQSTLTPFAHPCLSCKAGQTVAVNLDVSSTPHQVGNPVTLALTSSVDAAINNWLFRWDLNGDGIWDGPFTAGNSVQANFAIAGLKVVSGQAKNEQGDLGSATEVFNVEPGASVAQAASNPSVMGRFSSQSLIAAVGPSGLFLVADQVTRKLYFYDVLLNQITKELSLEMIPELIKLSPDNSTAFIQVVDRPQINVVSSTTERRYVIRVDIANYTATHSFSLSAVGGTLAMALNAERILTANNSTGTTLSDAKTGAVLSYLNDVFVTGNRAVIDNRVYLSAGTYVDFSNDVLAYKTISGTNATVSSATVALGGNKYVLDSDGRKLDLTTLKILTGQTPPWNFYSDSVSIIPQSNLGFSIGYSEIVFFNVDTLQVIKRVSAYEVRAAFVLEGQFYSFAYSPNVQTMQSICRECLDAQAPLAKLSVPSGVLDTSMSIRLDASASTDPEGSTLSFRWDFDGDGVWDSEYSATSVQIKKFLLPGKVTARVQVRDLGGNVADASVSFDVGQGVDSGVAVQSTRPFIFMDVPSLQVVDEVNGYLYYIAQDRYRLYAMNMATGLVERYFQFESRPQNLNISPDKKVLYFTTSFVSNLGQNQEVIVSSLDLASRTIVRAFKVKQNVVSLAPLGANRVVVANQYGSALSVYDSVSGEVLALFPQEYSLYLRGTLDESTVLVLQGFNGRYAKYRFDEQSMTLLSEELPGALSFNIDSAWLSADKTRVAFNNGAIYNFADSTLVAQLPAFNYVSALTFIDNQSLVWVDYYNNGVLHAYNIATATDTPGSPCNCQSLFTYAKQAWAVKRDDTGIYYASKVP